MKLKIAVPSKGRISDPTIQLLNRAGIGVKNSGDRKLFAETHHPDIQILFTRAADIPEFVEDGVADMGITGYDLIQEKQAQVTILEDLGFGQAKLILALPENSPIEKIEDIKDPITVATEFPNITQKYLEENNITAKIIQLTGATEIAPFIGVADMITDITSSGTTLKMNHLKIIDTLVESSIKLIARNNPELEKKPLMEEVRTGIKGALDADGKKLIMMNVDKKDLDGVTKLIPGMSGPTISQVLSQKDILAVHAVINENEVFQLVNSLKKAGARDILVLPIEKII